MSDSSTAVSTPSHVVGIGASAGGLDAIERFFDNLPRETGMAFVVVQHLSPDFKSMMDELLARHTELPIHLVEDGMPVEADHVYLIPPKTEMIISRRAPAAERAGSAAGADAAHRRLLSLAGAGLRRARRRDRAVGQRQRRVARHPRRPRGRRAGAWSRTRRARSSTACPGRPVDSRRRALRARPRRHAAGAASSTPRSRAQVAASAARAGDARGMGAVYRMLQEEFGIDFTHYKPSTVTRRIERRLALARIARHR